MEDDMKTLTILRWGVGGQEREEFEFEDVAVMHVLADANVAIHDTDEEPSLAIAFFGGVAEARWVSE
jgi:hypothetical protein